jgi:hypothetical protein
VSGQLGRRCTIVACPHVLHALNALPARTSCRPMMTQISGALETCLRALETYEPSCRGRSARLFFMFETRSPQGIAGRVAVQSPPSREVGSGASEHVAHQSPPSGSEATVHVTASRPFLLGKWDPKPLDT